MEDSDATVCYRSNTSLQASSSKPDDVSKQGTSSNDNNETYEMLDMDTQEHSNEYEQLQINEAYQHTTDACNGQDKHKTDGCDNVKVTVKALRKILITTILANTLMLVSIIAAVIALSVFNYHQSTSVETIDPDMQRNQLNQIAAATEANISQVLKKLEVMQEEIISLQAQLYCGAGQWYRVAYLNMDDPTEQCPPTWSEYNAEGVRACGRPLSSQGTCVITNYFSSYQYSKVCGRVVGYQVGSPDGFARFGDEDIDIDGVNITAGEEQQHIWSFIAGVSEGIPGRFGSNCPCSNISEQDRGPRPIIDNNFYCESGNPSNDFIDNQFFTNDPLWDGQQCEGICCTGTNSPPWFSVQLPAPINGMIQVSICADESTENEDTPIGLLEIFVQ